MYFNKEDSLHYSEETSYIIHAALTKSTSALVFFK